MIKFLCQVKVSYTYKKIIRCSFMHGAYNLPHTNSKKERNKHKLQLKEDKYFTFA